MSNSASWYGAPRSRSNSVWMTQYGEDEGTFGQISGLKYRKGTDESTLARLGKKQELERRFGFLSVFGFSCCVLVTWELAIVLLQEPLWNGGPAGACWGYLLSWVCVTSVYVCLAEMASIAPIAGGQYFWVAVLSPPRYKRFASYITGWLTSLAWVATIGVGMILTGTLITGVIKLDHPNYNQESYQGALTSWAVVAFALFINVALAGILPFLEGSILIVHILGYVAVMVTMLYLSPKVSVEEVFFKTQNLGGWSSQGLSLCVGLLGSVSPFVGADAAVHMAEEIENAAVAVPRAIFVTVMTNGLMGFGGVIAILFCLTDMEGALNTDTGYAFIEIIAHGCGTLVATILTAILIVMTWCSTIGFLATASRMIWSFARDRAIPFHQIFRKIHTGTSIPIYAVLLATIVPCLLALIYVGSPVAYSDIISMSVSGLYASYLIPCSLLLWRRSTGQIQPYADDYRSNSPEQFSLLPRRNALKRSALGADDDNNSDTDEKVVDIPLMWGPWRVPGLWGTVNNVFACAYCCFVLFWSFWPQYANPTAGEMNYAIVGFVAVLVFSVAYYYVWGHKEYKGPLVELGTRVVPVRQRNRS